MPYVAAFFALLAVGLIVALCWVQEHHTRLVCQIHDNYRAERAQLLNKITNPATPMPDPTRPAPKVAQRRTPENARDYARVGTVARPRRDNGTGEE